MASVAHWVPWELYHTAASLHPNIITKCSIDFKDITKWTVG